MCRRDRNAWSHHSHICCWISNCLWLKSSTSVTLSLNTEMRQLQPVVMFARSLQAPARGLLGDLKHSLLGSLGGFLDSLLSSLPGCFTSSPRSHADFTLSSRVLRVSHLLLFRCNPILPASSDAETFSSQIAEQELAVFWFLDVSKQRRVIRTAKPRVTKSGVL